MLAKHSKIPMPAKHREIPMFLKYLTYSYTNTSQGVRHSAEARFGRWQIMQRRLEKSSFFGNENNENRSRSRSKDVDLNCAPIAIQILFTYPTVSFCNSYLVKLAAPAQNNILIQKVTAVLTNITQ